MKFTALLMVVFLTLPQALFSSAAFAASNSRESCMNQWLFNGIWRVRVSNIEPLMDGPRQVGWQVTESWGNGTRSELTPGRTFLQSQVLELANGSISTNDAETSQLSLGGIANNFFAQAGQFTYKQAFYTSNFDPNNKPKGVQVLFDAGRLAQRKDLPHFTSSQYNDHFNLNCTASGAAAQAQGGATQLSANQGCMNQWMSNGVWKMRVTGLTPRYLGENDPSSNQIGWKVNQEWVNISHWSTLPGIFNSGAVVATNVTDEYLVTQSGNNVSSASAAGDMGQFGQHVFPPGASYSFAQFFTWSSFDKNDRPVRLLVTFNARAQNALPKHPHYNKTANFRIDLTCGAAPVAVRVLTVPS